MFVWFVYVLLRFGTSAVRYTQRYDMMPYLVAPGGKKPKYGCSLRAHAPEAGRSLSLPPASAHVRCHGAGASIGW